MKNLVIVLSVLFFLSCKKESLYDIPNVITPNGDGINDTWVIPFESATVSIFDRNNTILFETVNYQNNWSANGLDNGTYFYQINKSIVGSITVYR